MKAEPKADAAKRYDAIPFEFHLLQKSLQKIPDYMIDTVRRLFANDKHLFQYRSGRLLLNVFPTFTPEFEQSLQRLCESGDRDDLEFLVHILNGYNGQHFTHDLTKSIIQALPAHDPMWNRISIALDSTGMVRGEFGRVEAYRQKKSEIEPWLNEPREPVREFAKCHIHTLDQQIAAEQRRLVIFPCEGAAHAGELSHPQPMVGRARAPARAGHARWIATLDAHVPPRVALNVCIRGCRGAARGRDFLPRK